MRYRALDAHVALSPANAGHEAQRLADLYIRELAEPRAQTFTLTGSMYPVDDMPFPVPTGESRMFQIVNSRGWRERLRCNLFHNVSVREMSGVVTVAQSDGDTWTATIGDISEYRVYTARHAKPWSRLARWTAWLTIGIVLGYLYAEFVR